MTDDFKKYEDEKNSSKHMIGHLTGSANNDKLYAIKERLASKVLIVDKCSNPECIEPGKDSGLAACSRCGSVRYCCKGSLYYHSELILIKIFADCQVSHWVVHKIQCKAILKEREEKNKKLLEQIRESLDGVDLQNDSICIGSESRQQISLNSEESN